MKNTKAPPKDFWIIDDDETACSLYSRILRKPFGKEVRCFTSSINAFYTIKETTSKGQAPDIILLDVNMPGMSGFKLLQELYKDGINLENTAIYILTTSSLPMDRAKALTSPIEVKGYISKPLTPEKVEQILSSLTV